MRVLIARWVLGTAFSLALAAGGALLGALPAHGQSITGLGQTDQVFNACRYPTAWDVTACGEHASGSGGKGRP